MPQRRRDNRTGRRVQSIALCAPMLLILSLAQPAFAVPGALDGSFSGDGKTATLIGPNGPGAGATAQSVAIQANGQIVVVGSAGDETNSSFAVARYNTDGSLDSSLDGDGKLTTPFGNSSYAGATSVAIQPSDDKLVVAGWAVSGNNTVFALARYNTDGSLDSSFSGNGKLTTPFGSTSDATSVVIDANGQIVVAGHSLTGGSERFALARYNHTDGSLDSSFSGNGKLTTLIGSYAGASSLAIQPSDGKIVAAGYSFAGSDTVFALARYNTNGSLDNTLNGTGLVTIPFGSSSNAAAYSVAIQADGMIVAAGYSGLGASSDFAVARYDPVAGALDNNFSGNGKLTTSIGLYGSVYSLAIQADGMIVAAGNAVSGGKGVFAIARYDPSSGALDNSFDGDGKVRTLISFSAGATSVAIQPSDGQIVAAGYSDNGNRYRFAVARYDD